MATFGERLQREREMRGITLDEIAEATKIGTRSLRALEEQDFAKLPGGIFNKGFVRSYARFLGIDEDEAVADYQAAVDQAGAAVVAEGFPGRNQPSKTKGWAWQGLAAAALLAAASYLGWAGWAERRSSQALSASQAAGSPAGTISGSSQKPEESPPVVPDEAALPENGGPSPSPDGAAESAVEFDVRIRAVQDSWISIIADGEEVMAGTLSASSEKAARAHREVLLKVGNAAGVEVFYKGAPIPRLGEPNQTRTLTFTPEGFK